MRAFITVGPGGVGQSLNTCLIANLFGGSLGFMDMNVFYTEDELRKQADTFTGKVDVRGVTCSPPRIRKISLSWFLFRSNLAQRVFLSDERGPSGRPSPVRHLDEDGHIFGLEEVRDERDSQVPWSYGNDVPVDHETISHHQLRGEVC